MPFLPTLNPRMILPIPQTRLPRVSRIGWWRWPCSRECRDWSLCRWQGWPATRLPSKSSPPPSAFQDRGSNESSAAPSSGCTSDSRACEMSCEASARPRIRPLKSAAIPPRRDSSALAPLSGALLSFPSECPARESRVRRAGSPSAFFWCPSGGMSPAIRGASMWKETDCAENAAGADSRTAPEKRLPSGAGYGIGASSALRGAAGGLSGDWFGIADSEAGRISPMRLSNVRFCVSPAARMRSPFRPLIHAAPERDGPDAEMPGKPHLRHSCRLSELSCESTTHHPIQYP
jgi:hypothetical protein